MPKLIFDIETVGVEFESLDDKSKEFLLAYAESPEEIDDVKNGMGFSPLTGSIVAIGILNPDTEKGAVYFRTEGEKMDIVEEDGVHYVPCLNEKEILKKFADISGDEVEPLRKGFLNKMKDLNCRRTTAST